MLEPGDPAPDFMLEDDEGTQRNLAFMARLAPVVVYFYPADFTPVCTAEACMFREFHGELLGVGIQLVGISPQKRETHARFKQRHAIPFPLLADPEREVIRAYGATGPLGFGTRRVTYLIGPDLRVIDRVTAGLRVSRHRAFVERVIAEAGSAASGPSRGDQPAPTGPALTERGPAA